MARRKRKYSITEAFQAIQLKTLPEVIASIQSLWTATHLEMCHIHFYYILEMDRTACAGMVPIKEYAKQGNLVRLKSDFLTISDQPIDDGQYQIRNFDGVFFPPCHLGRSFNQGVSFRFDHIFHRK